MNVVANTCIGARLYQLESCQYNNPFIWNIIEFHDMYTLITRWEDINFTRFSISSSSYYNNIPYYNSLYHHELQQPFFIFKITIDNQVNIHYVHYRWRHSASTPTINNIDVYYNKIWEYITNKYIDRTTRMLNRREQPRFVIQCNEPSYTLNNQQKIMTITDRNITLITPHYDLLNQKATAIKLAKQVYPIGTCIEQAKHYHSIILMS